MSYDHRVVDGAVADQFLAMLQRTLESFDESAAQRRHFEMFPYTHSDFAGVLATDESDAPTNNPPPSPETDAAFAKIISDLSKVPPRDRLPIVNSIMGQGEPSERVDDSYKILTNVRNTRFNEMEYSVPIDAGAPCLREILKTIIDKEVDVIFPLEYRYVRHIPRSVCRACEDQRNGPTRRMDSR